MIKLFGSIFQPQIPCLKWSSFRSSLSQSPRWTIESRWHHSEDGPKFLVPFPWMVFIHTKSTQQKRVSPRSTWSASTLKCEVQLSCFTPLLCIWWLVKNIQKITTGKCFVIGDWNTGDGLRLTNQAPTKHCLNALRSFNVFVPSSRKRTWTVMWNYVNIGFVWIKESCMYFSIALY